MRKIATATFLLLTVIFSACHTDKGQGTLSFTIEGTLSNAAGRMLYIEEMTPDNGAQFLDSIQCDREGHFKYKGSMNYQTFFNLHASLYDYIVLLPNEGEEINISGDADNLGSTYIVDGSPESRLMWQIQSHINQANSTIGEIAQLDKQNRATLSDADYEKAHLVTDSIFIAERQTIYMTFYNFIGENRGSLSTLYAIDAPFNHTMRVFYAESDFEVFDEVLDGLLEVNPDNPHTQYYQTRVERARSARAIAQQQQAIGQEFIVE